MHCTPITVRTILNKTKCRDPWFLDDYTVNPYSGCSMGCVFCYVRGSKYGTHAKKKLSYKSNAVELLDKQLALRAKRRQYGFIVLSSATDPYVHAEKERMLTRALLQVIQRHRFPVHIITRSDMVLRDLDVLSEIQNTAIAPDDLREKIPARVFITFSFSTTRDHTAHIFEPGATPPSMRLIAMQNVLERGFYTGVSLMPLLPWITDTADELETSFATFSELGAKYIFPASLTLYGESPQDSKIRTLKIIENHYPQLMDKYLSYFAHASEIPSFYQTALNKKLTALCKKYRLRDRIC